MNNPLQSFWSQSVEVLLKSLETTSQGLTQDEAAKRLIQYRSDLIKPQKRFDLLSLFFLKLEVQSR
ncbi:cation-transporting P-type ATPase [Paenibacillus sp. N3.4]|uniref:cation-transporting P-type ATPase n=1 Tax=Paenibacillus sp. N3.4 TaxID=2603222 RepID=UPI001C9CAF08|nr:cation-transporting P-type ATPase [Paenibacillus sp. N3.4]